MKPIIHNVSETTTHTHTRRFKSFLTDEQVSKHLRGLEAQDKLHRFVLRYLEKSFGYKKLRRRYPTGKYRKVFINKLKELYMAKIYKELGLELTTWSVKHLGLSSQSANAFIADVMVQFGKYRETLIETSKWTDDEKEDYRKKHGKSWFRRHALSYDKTSRTITVQGNNQVEVLSDHHIKIPDFGDIQILQNIKNLKGSKIKIMRIKYIREGEYEFQIVFTTEVERQAIDINNDKEYTGYDWGLLNNEFWHGTDGTVIKLDERVLQRAKQYEEAIKRLDTLIQTCPNKSKLKRYKDQRKRLYAKCTNLLNEEYRRHARLLLDGKTMIVIEDLNAKSMRNETGGKSKKTKGMNKKLALAKPATMRDFIIQRANNIGATVVLVNPNFTSQIEFGVLHEPKKIPLDVREWISEFTGRLIERDYNAAWNILFWGLYPEYHYLVSTGKSAKYLSRTN